MTLVTAWQKAIAFWGYPPIEVEHYTSKEAATKVMGDSIAHFDFARQRARINIPKLEERLGIDCLEPVDKHEIGHYVFCPYDIKSCLTMIQGANRVVNDYTKAKYIENIVADLMLNTHIVNKGDKSIITVYERMGKTDDALWTTIMRSCELLWHLQAESLSHKTNGEVEHDAQKIAQIVGNSMYLPSTWAGATEECARILSKYEIKENDERRMIDGHKPSDFFIDENGIGKAVSGISKSLSYKDFVDVAAGTELCTNTKAAQLYHGDVAQKYIIQPPTAQLPLFSNSPATPREWNTEDDIEKLDLAYSLQQGLLIPGETTYQWHAQDNPTIVSQSYRDLFICLDSSTSMPDPSRELSIPVVASLALSRSAHRRGAQAAALTFSMRWKACGYTHHDRETDEVLHTYLSGGTIIPAQAIVDTVKAHQHPQHIVIITDAAIGNLERDKKLLAEARSCAQGGTIFLYRSATSSATSLLTSLGYAIRPATTEADLLRMTHQLGTELYGT